MADNWSSSVLTLTDRGDWAKWDFTIPDSQAADDFNGDPNFARQLINLRHALSAANRDAFLILVVNDVIARVMGLDDIVSSSGAWISNNRFNNNFESASGTFATPNAQPELQTPIAVTDLAPFVVGTNTLRLLALGSSATGDEGDPEPIEIDVLFLDVGDFPALARVGAFYDDDTTSQSAPADFATHVNGDPFDAVGPTTDDHGWLLKAPDATTGTAGLPVLEVVRMCPSGGGNVTARLRITEDGTTPVAGIVGVQDIFNATTQTATLDGSGEAEFTFPDSADVAFWYGGNDDWMPLAVEIPDGFRIGCTGWVVGRVGT